MDRDLKIGNKGFIVGYGSNQHINDMAWLSVIDLERNVGPMYGPKCLKG